MESNRSTVSAVPPAIFSSADMVTNNTVEAKSLNGLNLVDGLTGGLCQDAGLLRILIDYPSIPNFWGIFHHSSSTTWVASEQNRQLVFRNEAENKESNGPLPRIDRLSRCWARSTDRPSQPVGTPP